uniref:NADH dehydrogenase subunit 6 n=1 Tax=Micromelo undatus TaxID=340426 RepID=E6Y181_MICUD|nr:NADH dehydrogenase subunit 6 [Micromelo undatus]ABK92254.1 NADH dehydrogenase subunit 6 [Micromelo undatus]
MKFLVLGCLLLSLFLPLYKNPVSMAGLVVMLSFFLISIMACLSSQWYSYVLFLVYVGGLLVMFIYVCLVSSNYPFQVKMEGLLSSSFLTMILMSSIYNNMSLSSNFSGKMSSGAGATLVLDSSLSLFIGLVILLLAMLLVVVRTTGAGSIFIGNEKT